MTPGKEYFFYVTAEWAFGDGAVFYFVPDAPMNVVAWSGSLYPTAAFGGGGTAMVVANGTKIHVDQKAGIGMAFLPTLAAGALAWYGRIDTEITAMDQFLSALCTGGDD